MEWLQYGQSIALQKTCTSMLLEMMGVILYAMESNHKIDMDIGNMSAIQCKMCASTLAPNDQ